MSGAATLPAHRVCVSTAGGGELRVLEVDARQGTLIERQCLVLGGALMPMALNPQRNRLYVSRRSVPYAVLSLAIDSEGLLSLMGESALPVSMAYIATDRTGRFLFSASYGEHQIAVSTVDALGVARDVIQRIDTEPHAHAIQADLGNGHVFATCLGGDLMRRFDFDAQTGRLSDHAEPRVPVLHAASARTGPRHFVFHPNRRWMFVLNELDASVAAFGIDAGTGRTSPMQVISSLPPGFAGEPWAAEIRLLPDGLGLVVSERRTSTLTAFRIDAASGALSLVGRQPTQTQPRGFAITPDGHWLVVAGQVSNRVAVHPIDAVTGAIGPYGPALDVGADPTWVENLPAP
jgi:6-phosphogluconolactonase